MKLLRTLLNPSLAWLIELEGQTLVLRCRAEEEIAMRLEQVRTAGNEVFLCGCHCDGQGNLQPLMPVRLSMRHVRSIMTEEDLSAWPQHSSPRSGGSR